MAINHHTSPEQLALNDSLSKATDTVGNLPFDTDFQSYATKRSIDVTTSENDPFLYWQAVEGFTHTEVMTQPGHTKLEKEALAVVSGLPLTLTQSYSLEAYGHTMSYRERRPLKEGVSEYNKLLKDFIEAHPQSSDELKARLLEATLATLGGDHRDLTDHAEKSIEARLKGMKHEMAFAKVLDSLGVPWREATVDEDLKGRDLIIDFMGREIGIDVKASLSEVTAHEGDATRSPVVYDARSERFIVFSGFVDKDFQGTFDIPNAVIEERAPMIGALLQAAIMQQTQNVLR